MVGLLALNVHEGKFQSVLVQLFHPGGGGLWWQWINSKLLKKLMVIPCFHGESFKRKGIYISIYVNSYYLG